MFSIEQRWKAIELFIKYDHSYAAVTWELGYPDRHTLYKLVEGLREACGKARSPYLRRGNSMPKNEKTQSFDLNIEDVLSHWCVKDAIREFIANAIDETVLSKCAQPEVEYNSQKRMCLIRDYGRGLEVSHLTQNESIEKAEASGVIGRFGVGLKDALAVLYEHGASVTIDSCHMHMTLEKMNKHGFDIPTLHAVIQDSTQPDSTGTLVRIENVSQQDVLEAKEMFLRFNGAVSLYSGDCGDIIASDNGPTYVYVNGLRIAEDESLKFSYNITKLDSKLRKNLNRERNAVGRTAYTGSIKKILLSCESDEVWDDIAADLTKEASGRCAEAGWSDICAKAAEHLNKSNDDHHVFMTQEERNQLTAVQVEKIQNQGREVTIIPRSAKEKAFDFISTMEDVEEEYKNSFEFEFIDPMQLSSVEREVWNDIAQVDELVKKRFGKPMPRCLVSETMMSEDARGPKASGLWSPQEQAIIVKRSALDSRNDFLGTLLHEYCHYLSGCTDNTRGFENALTDMCGVLAESLFDKQSADSEPEIYAKPSRKSFFGKLLGR